MGYRSPLTDTKSYTYQTVTEAKLRPANRCT